MSEQYHSLKVDGGALHYRVWGEHGPLVLASHGLTATHIQFQALADQLDGRVRLVAPDHRGRGRSRDVGEPFGMTAHARDLLAILDDLGEARADLLLGHSMGGFVVAVAGALAPERVGGILLVDGGLPSIDKMPEGVSIEELTQAIIGPALERLKMRFPSAEAYLDFWRQHPAFSEAWSPYVEQFARYDLIGEAPELHSGVSGAAVIADVQTQLRDDLIPRSLRALRMPLTLMTAPRGVMNGDPLYAPAALQDWRGQLADVQLHACEDVNHYTIALSAHGAAQINEQINALLARVYARHTIA